MLTLYFVGIMAVLVAITTFSLRAAYKVNRELNELEEER